MSEVESDDGHKIGFACIRFQDRGNSEEYNIVPLDFVKEKFNKGLKKFEPADENDFNKDQLYRVYWRCDGECREDHDHEAYYKAHVLHLGESEHDVKKKITAKRLRFPNRKYCGTTSSSTDIDECGSKSSVHHSKIDIQRQVKESIKKRNREKAGIELQEYYATKQLETRPPVVDSDSADSADYNKLVQTPPGLDTGIRKLPENKSSGIQEPPSTPPLQREKQNESSTSRQKERSTSRQNKASPSRRNETSISRHKERSTSRQNEASTSRQNEASTSRQNEAFTSRQKERSTSRENEAFTSRQNETSISRQQESSTSRRTSDENHIRADHLAHLTNVRTPERLRKRQASSRNISTERHGLRRFNIVNGKIYLGLDVFIGKECWADTMTQKPTTFIRDVATLIWQEEGVLNRCFRTDKVSVSFQGRSPRKEFEADKLQLLRDLLDHYLEYHSYTRRDKDRIKRSINLICHDMSKMYANPTSISLENCIRNKGLITLF